MMEETNTTGKSATNPPGANTNKIMLSIILGLTVLLIITMVAGIYLLMNSSNIKNGSGLISKKTSAEQTQETGFFMPLGKTFQINIRSEDGSEYYLITDITLEVTNNQKVIEEMTNRLPQIRDMMVLLLHSKTKEKFETQEGLGQIKTEIITKANRMFGEKIKRVLFESLIYQPI